MLTKACIDPFSKHQSHLFGIFKLDQILMIIYSSSFIYFNIYLHKFLKTQNDQNKSQTLDNYKKVRRRNLVPAKVGVMHAIAVSVTYICKYKFTVMFDKLNYIILKPGLAPTIITWALLMLTIMIDAY